MPDSDVQLRTLREGEEERVLEFLDGWPFTDNRRGREFFRRPIEHDPRYESRNFVVAEVDDRFVACVQIFPRWIRVRGQPVPTGGIGSVFTDPDYRRLGIAERLLELATSEMCERGFELSLLWASRVSWYTRLGWNVWGGDSYDLGLREDAPAAPTRSPIEIERFDREVHLPAIMELADLYSSQREGTVVRNRADWLASLEMAGDPHEEFLVVREVDSPQLSAFLRGTMLGGNWCATEWAHDATDEGGSDYEAAFSPPQGARHLALLIATTLRALGLSSLRFPLLRDALLEEELREVGVSVVGAYPKPVAEWALHAQEPPPAAKEDEVDGRSLDGRSFWMLRCLHPEALAERFDLAWEPELKDAKRRFLETLLPRHAFNFWPADRF